MIRLWSWEMGNGPHTLGIPDEQFPFRTSRPRSRERSMSVIQWVLVGWISLNILIPIAAIIGHHINGTGT